MTDTFVKPDRLVARLLLVVVAMFAFGYALVPLYDMFCDIAGIGGRSGQVEEQFAQDTEVALDRWVTVEFTGVSTSDLPWDFKPMVNKLKIHPGEITDVVYLARNTSSRQIVGQAIPNIVPSLASKYFNKTECFCFTQQTLAAGEEKEMAVRFIVDPKLPEDVNTIILSYSFFNAEKYAQN